TIDCHAVLLRDPLFWPHLAHGRRHGHGTASRRDRFAGVLRALEPHPSGARRRDPSGLPGRRGAMSADKLLSEQSGGLGPAWATRPVVRDQRSGGATGATGCGTRPLGAWGRGPAVSARDGESGPSTAVTARHRRDPAGNLVGRWPGGR